MRGPILLCCETRQERSRDTWCLSGAAPAFGLYESTGKQIWSSPLTAPVSWHEAAGQRIPKLPTEWKHEQKQLKRRAEQDGLHMWTHICLRSWGSDSGTAVRALAGRSAGVTRAAPAFGGCSDS